MFCHHSLDYWEATSASGPSGRTLCLCWVRNGREFQKFFCFAIVSCKTHPTMIASTAPQWKRTVKTMDTVGVIPHIVAKITLSHTASIAAVMTIGVMTAMMTTVDPKRSSNPRINMIVRSPRRVSTCMKNSAWILQIGKLQAVTMNQAIIKMTTPTLNRV